jgi:hypothetical protein
MASPVHRAAAGSSTSTAISSEVSSPEPGAAVVTSNQASASSKAAVPAAVRQARASRRSSRIPVLNRPAASIASRPVQAAGQCQAIGRAGRLVAR